MRSVFLNFLLPLWHVIKNFPNFSVKVKRCKLRKLNPTLSMICLPRCFVTDNVASSSSKPFLQRLKFSEKVVPGELNSLKIWRCYKQYIASEYIASLIRLSKTCLLELFLVWLC